MQKDPYAGNTFEECLRIWALETGQTLHAVNLLLQHLRKHTYSDLPTDARTLLKPPSATIEEREIVPIPGGQLWYQGVKRCLQLYFSSSSPPDSGFCVDFFFDGLPLYKSSKKQFWPILMKIHNMPQLPVMTVVIYRGELKPLFVKDYLRPFVIEVNELQTKGPKNGGRMYWVSLRAIITDSPARSYIKGVKGHNAIWGCHKCKSQTEVMPGSARRFYPYNADSQPRTDALFRAGAYSQHIVNPTPLSDLIKCDLIRTIVVSDRLHLIDQGVMKKLLKLWTQGISGCVAK
uniref:Transposase domain-containing protein n=1 Tax=Anopheles epiroticus TaxID=199890 RepID=A0A182PWQ2_9DIPT